MPNRMKHFIALTCEALARSAYAAAATSPHAVSVRLFRQGLHDTPKNLKDLLQEEVDTIEPGECDAILLGYGLCGNATLGLTARHTPIVTPRAHDCITLYLGSRQRYLEAFKEQPGTYWYSLDYLERNQGDIDIALGASSQETLSAVYEEYVEKYGEDNANYLMEVMGAWKQHYSRAVYIHLDLGEDDTIEQRVREEASRRGWTFERMEGDRRLINQLIHGEWPEEDFLFVPPGHAITSSTKDDLVVEAVEI